MLSNQDNKISVQQFGAALTKVTPRLWIIIILASLLLPPLGLVIALYLAFRGFKLHKKNLYLMAAAALASAALGLAGLYAIRSITYDQNLDHYKYSQLEDYKLESKLDGTDISFKKPPELKEISHNALVGSSGASFGHVKDKSGSKTGLSYLLVSLKQSALAASQGYMVELGEILKDPNHKTYQKTVQPIKDFAKVGTLLKTDVELSIATVFTNSNISKNAWKFDFSAKNSQNNLKTVKGTIILAAGKTTFYYFFLDSLEYNWDSNQKVWQQVLDSIKIDQ